MATKVTEAPAAVAPAPPVVMEPMPAWERLEGESSLAYESFCAYRDLGPERSLAKAGIVLKKSVGTLSIWSMKYQWVARALAYDDAYRRKELQKKDAARTELIERHRNIGSAILAQASRYLTPPDTQPDGKTPLTEEEKRKWKAKVEVVRMATHALKEVSIVQRLTLGLPTVISKTQVETEEAIREALESQRLIQAIVAESQDSECDCLPCRTTRARLLQVVEHQRRASELLTPGT